MKRPVRYVKKPVRYVKSPVRYVKFPVGYAECRHQEGAGMCEAWYRLHTAVVGGPERINDRGIKGIFGESEACLAMVRLHAGGIAAPLVIFIKL